MRVRPTRALREWWSTRAPHGQFWVYFAAAIFFNLGFSIFYFLFNLYLVGTGLNESSLGVIGSAMAVGSLCGTIPAGMMAERKGLRWTLTSGIALACVVSALRVLIVWTPAQVGLAVLSGFAMCTWAVCLSPAVAGLTNEEQRPAAFSLMFSSGIGVAGFGGLAAGYLPKYVRAFASWPVSVGRSEQITLLLACGISILALIPISRLTLRSASSRPRLLWPSNTFLRRFLPAMAVWSFVTSAFPPFATVYFVHHLGLSLESTGAVLSLSQGVQFAAILVAPLLLQRAGLTRGVMLTQIGTGLFLFLLARTRIHWQAAGLYWLYMTAQCMNEPGIYSLLMDGVPADARQSASSYTFFVSAGSQILASVVVGFAIVHFNYSLMLCCIGVVALIAAILFQRLQQFHSGGVDKERGRREEVAECSPTL